MDIKTVKDAYPLSPLQQGMLFHHLYARRSGVDIEQIICALHEDLQISALDQAWQRVIAHHPALRTSFRWEGLDEPVQQVHDFIAVPLQAQDWREFSSAEQEARLQSYLQTDRLSGFDLAEAPLIRLALFRVGVADYRLVWSSHHILLDGWSFPLILKEVFALYEAIRQGQGMALPPARPYRDYINWVYEQDWSQAETFWRDRLKDYTSPLVLGNQTGFSQEAGYGRSQTSLSASLTATLKSFAGQHELTLNTLMQGAWALLVSRYSGQQDVVFGATRACRRSALDGAEDMIGLLINTLPVRVRISSETSLLPWLQELRAQQIAVREYELTPLAEVQGWSELPRGTQLFESLLVFENYQLNALLQAQGGDWQWRQFQYLGQTNYLLTVLCYAEQELLIQIEYDQARFDDAAITRMLGHLETLLAGMADNAQRRLCDYPLLTKAERAQLLVEWNATEVAYPSQVSLHGLFEKQVEKTPDRLALDGAMLALERSKALRYLRLR